MLQHINYELVASDNATSFTVSGPYGYNKHGTGYALLLHVNQSIFSFMFYNYLS